MTNISKTDPGMEWTTGEKRFHVVFLDFSEDFKIRSFTTFREAEEFLDRQEMNDGFLVEGVVKARHQTK